MGPVTNAEELVKVLGLTPVEGRARTFTVRCRVPFVFNMAPAGLMVRDTERPGEVVFSQRGSAPPASLEAPESQEESGDDSPLPSSRTEGETHQLITGPASSTSVDWYETRMGVDALRSMATQFRSGIDYFPRHHGFLSAVEWNEVIGRTVGAELRRERVKAPREESDADQFVLYVDTLIDLGEELGVKLVRRIEDGNPPGQSIGGWFTEVSVTYDEDGYPIDVVILDVDLDHLAAVRSPANPDADRIWTTLEGQLAAAFQEVQNRNEDAPESENDEAENPEELEASTENAEPEGDTDTEEPPAESTEEPPEPEATEPEPPVDADNEPADETERSQPVAVGQRGAVPVDVAGLLAQRHVMGVQVEDDRVVISLERESDDEEDDDGESESIEASTPTPEPGGEPPVTGDRNATADQEIDMTPEVLAAAIGAVLDARGLTGPGSAPPADPPPSNPPSVEDDPEVLRAQLEAERAARAAAEARAAAAARIGSASPVPAARSTFARTEQPANAEAPVTRAQLVEEQNRAMADYHGLDMRNVAPGALHAVGASFGMIELNAELVARCDGLEAVATMAKADGSGRSLATLLTERDTDIMDVHVLKCRSKKELERTMGSVLFAGWQDRTFAKTRPAGQWG